MMKLKELKELLDDPMLDDELEISIPDNTFDPTGVIPINKITELYNGLDQIIGYVIV